MLVTSFVSFSQVIEVEFDSYIGFNSGNKGNYEDVIDSNNYLEIYKHFGGTNKYVVDLTNKRLSRYFSGKLSQTTDIVSYKKVGGLVYLTFNSKETLTNNIVEGNIVINTNKSDKTKPYFVMYFVSTYDNTTNGSIVRNL